MDNIGGYRKIEYCYTQEISNIGVTTAGMVIKLNPNGHFKTIPTHTPGKISISETPTTEQGTTIYTTEITVRVPAGQDQDLKRKLNNAKCVVIATHNNGNKTAYGNIQHPLKAKVANVTPPTPEGFSHQQITFSATTRHGSTKIISLS